MKSKAANSPRDLSESQPLTIRIDKLLWFLRFARNRNIARKLATKGHVRLNGRRVERAHSHVRVGDILTIPQSRDVHVIRVIALPKRRSAASIVQGCFERLETGE